MAKNHERLQLQQEQTFDDLMCFLNAQFKSFPDHRVGHAVRYELADVLKSAFAMFSLRSCVKNDDGQRLNDARRV
jgi:hypothetical protein